MGGTAEESNGLSDGSRVTTAPGTRLEWLENTGDRVALALRRGRARFDVRPRGPRTWRIQAGAVTVEVVGTAFTVTRTTHDTSIEVHRGAVLVRGDGVPDAVQRVSGGQSFTTAAEAARPASSTTREPVEIEPTPDDQESPDTRAAMDRSAPPLPLWRQAAEAGAYDDAFENLGGHGLAAAARRAASVAELMTLADVARLSGHPADAVSPLERVMREYPNDARAALAAYTLGRLQLEQLGRPAEAADAFATSLRLGLPSGLQESALAKRVEAFGRVRSPETAIAIDAYLRAYPDGRYRAAVERWRATE
jgi:transmembrane sensor